MHLKSRESGFVYNNNHITNSKSNPKSMDNIMSNYQKKGIATKVSYQAQKKLGANILSGTSEHQIFDSCTQFIYALRTKHSQEGMDCNIPKHILIFIK
jgi:hypothetical protein